MVHYQAKRERLLDAIEDKSIVLLTSGVAIKKSADENYPFSVNRNFYYLTGIDEEEVILLMLKVDNTKTYKLFIREADPLMEKWVGKTINKVEAKEKAGISEVGYLEELKEYIIELCKQHDLLNVYIDDEDSKHIHFGKDLIAEHDILKSLSIHNIYPLIIKQRVVKSEEEINAIRTAITKTNIGIMNMLKHMKPKMYEYELVAHFDYALKANNSRSAFSTIAAGGKRATILHYITNDELVNDNELVLFDLGATYQNYCADISRTFPISGKFSPRQKEIYEIVLKAQKAVIKAIKPNVTLAQLQAITVDVFQKELMKIGLIKTESIEEVRRYYYHGVSHSLGLDTHDVGIGRDDPLPINAVITVEPGLYIEEEAIGIRIEDDVLITETGAEVLSAEIIKEVAEIENFFDNKV